MHRWFPRRSIPVVLVLVAVALGGCGGSSSAGVDSVLLVASSTDTVKLRFSAFGDLQIGTVLPSDPSSTNVPQLRQTIADMNGASPRPRLALLDGDIVLGLIGQDGKLDTCQLNAWQSVYTSLPGSGSIPLLPIPGNHEVCAVDIARNTTAPNAAAVEAWVAWCAQNGYNSRAGNGPNASGDNPDSLVRDESQLTYSFNVDDTHFIAIDTDTLTSQTDPTTGVMLSGWIPINWIEQDMKKAQADPSTSAIIVVGHKPIEPPPYSTEDPGIYNTAPYLLADRLSRLMSLNSKVKLFLACHCHSWDARRLNNGQGVWQVIVGNGGAPIQEGWNPSGGIYFGYSLVDLYASGKVVVTSYGRPLPPAPQAFYEDGPVPPEPATVRAKLVI